MKSADFFELRALARHDANLRRAERTRHASQCEGKHRFESFGAADGTIRRDLRKEAKVYHCALCRGFHIGSVAAKRWKRLSIKRRRDECVSA